MNRTLPNNVILNGFEKSKPTGFRQTIKIAEVLLQNAGKLRLPKSYQLVINYTDNLGHQGFHMQVIKKIKNKQTVIKSAYLTTMWSSNVGDIKGLKADSGIKMAMKLIKETKPSFLEEFIEFMVGLMQPQKALSYVY